MGARREAVWAVVVLVLVAVMAAALRPSWEPGPTDLPGSTPAPARASTPPRPTQGLTVGGVGLGMPRKEVEEIVGPEQAAYKGNWALYLRNRDKGEGPLQGDGQNEIVQVHYDAQSKSDAVVGFTLERCGATLLRTGQSVAESERVLGPCSNVKRYGIKPGMGVYYRTYPDLQLAIICNEDQGPVHEFILGKMPAGRGATP